MEKVILFILLGSLLLIWLIYIHFKFYKKIKTLELEAYYDKLTGANQLSRFTNIVNGIMEECTDGNIAILNIKQFKFINEIFGREKADLLLKYVSEVIKAHITSQECYCRSTTDEFVIFLHGRNMEEIKARIRSIIEKISTDAMKEYRNYRVGLYCGVVSQNGSEEKYPTCEEMITHATFAMKKAKEMYQNEIWVYDLELHKKELLENYVESHMNKALDKSEFKILLQPKINLQTKKVEGAEALVRWILEDGTMLSPNDFIPVFERNGFCSELDMYILEWICKKIRNWIDQGIDPVPISINQSKLLFVEDDYVEKVCYIIEKYKIPYHLISLEILEGLALEDAESINSKILQLQEKGIQVSMDDFGSGYSSLNSLAKLNIDELKLDRAFLVTALDEKTRQFIIMKKIVEMARELGISTVAEGIETKEDEKLIAEIGCNYGQGFCYSKPISVPAFQELYLM